MLLLLISALSLPPSLVVGSTEAVLHALLLHRTLPASFELTQLPPWPAYVDFSYPQPPVGIVSWPELVEFVVTLFLFVFELADALFLP